MNLDQYTWKCSCCGEERNGLPPALGFLVPDHWLELDEETKKNSKISDDFCLINTKQNESFYYIRCVMEMPLIGEAVDDSLFGFGVWMSVSKQSWKINWDGFNSGKYSEEGCFGYLSNRISTYPDSFNLPADIFFQPGNQRPLVVLHDGSSAIIYDQTNGMKIEIIEALVSKRRH